MAECPRCGVVRKYLDDRTEPPICSACFKVKFKTQEDYEKYLRTFQIVEGRD